MIISLNKLPLNTTAQISSLHCSAQLSRRLLDLGLIKNAYITPVLQSPSGDPVAFDIKGMTLALREEDSKLIDVYL